MPLLSTFGGASIRGFMSGKTFKTYTLIADTTVGTATTSVTFSGLNYNASDELLLVSDLKNLSGLYSEYLLFANGNTTQTNYYMQQLVANSTSVSGVRLQRPIISTNETNMLGFVNTKIKLTNNSYFVYQSEHTYGYGGNLILEALWYGTSTFTATSITSLTVTATNTNAIGIGSRFQLYKINP